jgi:hypothetical protein
MKSMTVAEFKTHFSEVIDQVKAGEKIEVTFGKSKEVVGYFTANLQQAAIKRQLGILEGKARVTFSNDFKMSEDEFLGS